MFIQKAIKTELMLLKDLCKGTANLLKRPKIQESCVVIHEYSYTQWSIGLFD